jgi:hypothetical protein
MARVTYVKSARQRYKMVPVLNEDGSPKVTPVLRRDGSPKKTKRGREVTMRVTVQDKTQPLPNLRCDFPGCDIDGGEILPGTSYKHITPRSGPYGGTQRNRHAAHPSWNVWEYSYSRAAQVARVCNDMSEAIDSWEPTDESDFDSLRDELEQMAQEAADEAREAVDNMPEQLQDGSQAAENADMLEDWVGEFGNASAPDEEFYEDCEVCDGTGETMQECDTCGGSGEVEDDDEPEGTRQCDDCGGSGEVEDSCEECDGGKTDVVSEDWIEAAREALREPVDACPL